MAERYVTGHKNGRTIYRVQPDGSEVCVGLLDTPELAQEFVDALNGAVDDRSAGYDEGRRAGRQEAARAIRTEAELLSTRGVPRMYTDEWGRAARIAEGEPEP